MPANFPETAPFNLLAGAPAVPPAEAQLSRLLGRGRRLALPDTAPAWLVLPTIAGGAETGAGDWLLLDTGAGPLYVEDGARFIAGLTGIDGGAGGAPWPQWMAGAVAGRLHGTPLAGVRAVSPHAAPGAAFVHLAWRLEDAGHAVGGRAAAPAATWCALLDGAGHTPLRMPWSGWRGLALDWPVILATHRLPLALYDTLAAGDLILPCAPLFDAGGAGRLTLGTRRYRAAFVHPAQLALLEEEITVHTELTDDATIERPADPEEDGAEGPGAVSVTLRFELGRIRLTLDALRALGPDSVLDVQGGAPHAITLRCGGTDVGRGEVVDVDGRLGVRITAWSGAC